MNALVAGESSDSDACTSPLKTVSSPISKYRIEKVQKAALESGLSYTHRVFP